MEPREQYLNVRKRLEERIDELPVLPTIVAKLMMLDTDNVQYFDQVLGLIQVEPNFATRLLSVANSAAGAAVATVLTLRGAINRIGSVNASNLVIAASVARVFVPRDAWEKSLWRHALQVAIASRLLAERSDGVVRPDEAYTCGLLHDVGRFVMFQEAPAELRRVGEGDWESPETLAEVERSICGLDHAELGAAACTKLRIPDLIRTVVRDHHTQHLRRSTDADRLSSIVRVADLAMFPSALPGTPGLNRATPEVVEQLLRPKMPSFVPASTDDLCRLISAASSEAAHVGREFGIG